MHTRQAFDAELNELKQNLLEMAGYVEQMIAGAVDALARHDRDAAMQIILQDDTVDQMDVDIEQKCLRLLALQQPMAIDLRIIGTVLKLLTDVERIGDHAVDIARAAKKLAKEEQPELLVDILKLASLSRSMLRDSLDAFVQLDETLIHKVCESDNEVDQLYKSLRHQLHDIMRSDPELVVAASWQLLVVYYLERVADHATNIAERVNYILTGKLDQLARKHHTDRNPDTSSSDE